jgi:hypothetical protein
MIWLVKEETESFRMMMITFLFSPFRIKEIFLIRSNEFKQKLAKIASSEKKQKTFVNFQSTSSYNFLIRQISGNIFFQRKLKAPLQTYTYAVLCSLLAVSFHWGLYEKKALM